MEQQSVFFSEDSVLGHPSAIGYEKKFRWAWMATQLNTFIVASDFNSEAITPLQIEEHLDASFKYAQNNYSGWMRGLQSGLGVISILLSENVDEKAKEYCLRLKSGKKWAGFTIPVVINTSASEAHYFKKKPLWGRIYYPHFEKLIENTLLHYKEEENK